MSRIPRLYFLGTGRTSNVLLNALAQLPSQQENPSIVLLLESKHKLRSFLKEGTSITVLDYTRSQTPHITTSSVMSACEPPKYKTGDFAQIENLIVSEDLANPLKQLELYRPCLGPQSNVFFLNSDKMALVNAFHSVWLNPCDRPRIFQSFNTLRLSGSEPFKTNYVAPGSLVMSQLPADIDDLDTYAQPAASQPQSADAHSQYIFQLLQELNGSLDLSLVSYNDYVLQQLEDVVVSASVGLLTSCLNCSEPELLHISNLDHLLRRVLRASISIVLSEPALAANPNAKIVFNDQRLHTLIIDRLHQDNEDRKKFYDKPYQFVSGTSRAKSLDSTRYLTYLAAKNNKPSPTFSMLASIQSGRESLDRLKKSHVDSHVADYDDIGVDIPSILQ